MVGRISYPVGQELAQIARQKRGPFQRPDATPPPRDPAAVTITKSKKAELPRNYNIKGPVSGANLIGDAVSTEVAEQTDAPRISNGHPAGGSSLLTLQDVSQQDEQTSAPIGRQNNGWGRGLALGHDKERGSKPAIGEKLGQAPQPISLDSPRPPEDSEPKNFIKRYQHRDFNAEVALSLLSEGTEQARDASLSVKFQAYADSATEKSRDRHFVQQLLNGAEKV